MADLSKSQQKRAQARERRRKQSDDSALGNGADSAPGNDELAPDGSALGKAAKGAVAAAAVGAAAAAARALASHDDEQPEEPQEQAEPEAESEEKEAQAEKPEQQEPEPEREAEPQPEREEQPEPVAGAAPSDARRVLDRGREQLEDLLGRPVESVSSLERTHDGWVLALEVVEVRRVPETMDVLASYEMELDDELNLRRYQQARRYNRSRAGDDL